MSPGTAPGGDSSVASLQVGGHGSPRNSNMKPGLKAPWPCGFHGVVAKPAHQHHPGLYEKHEFSGLNPDLLNQKLS